MKPALLPTDYSPSLKEWESDEMVNAVEACSDAGIYIFFFPVKLFDAVLAHESQ